MRRVASDKRYVIDVSKPWHVAWWATELGVSEDALLNAVSAAGNQARAVEHYLRRGKALERLQWRQHRHAPKSTSQRLYEMSNAQTPSPVDEGR